MHFLALRTPRTYHTLALEIHRSAFYTVSTLNSTLTALSPHLITKLEAVSLCRNNQAGRFAMRQSG